MFVDNLNYISWKKENGTVIEGYFIKTKMGYMKVKFFEDQYYSSFPEDALIQEAELNLLTGKVVIKK